MIWGSIRFNGGAIITHKKTFVLSPLDYFDVYQPLLMPTRILGGAFIGFTAVFADLLYPVEMASILGASFFSIGIGWQIAQLRFHGGNLRGTTYGHALWGRYASLQKIHSEISDKFDFNKENDRETAQ